MDKKGRIFGLGLEGGKYKPSNKSSIGISLYGYDEQMRIKVSNLIAKKRALRRNLKMFLQHLQEQMRRFMKTFALSHLPPPPPAPTNEDDQQDDKTIYDDLDADL